MIRVPLPINQPQRQHAGQPLGDNRRKPDAVHAEQRGQKQHADGLKHQRARKGNHGGNQAVVQRGEEAGGKDVEARQQEGEREDRKRVQRQRIQPFVIAHEEFRQRRGQTQRQRRQRNACHTHQRQALFQHVFQLVVVARAEVIADDRRAARCCNRWPCR